MLLHILQATPVRIWILLGGLVAVGLSQTRARTMSATRAGLLPVAMLALSMAGVATSFHAGVAAYAAWALGLAAALVLTPKLLPRTAATWAAGGRSVHVAGSVWPLLLILSLFATKYVAGVSLALHPELATDAAFAESFGLAYGLFAGVFAARGLQLWSARRAPAFAEAEAGSQAAASAA